MHECLPWVAVAEQLEQCTSDCQSSWLGFRVLCISCDGCLLDGHQQVAVWIGRHFMVCYLTRRSTAGARRCGKVFVLVCILWTRLRIIQLVWLLDVIAGVLRCALVFCGAQGTAAWLRSHWNAAISLDAEFRPHSFVSLSCCTLWCVLVFQYVLSFEQNCRGHAMASCCINAFFCEHSHVAIAAWLLPFLPL